jgi:predicted RNase H-like HicB family nuclease
MTVYSYPITIEKEGKQYYAYNDDRPRVYGLARTFTAAKRNIVEAMHLHTKYSRRSC